MRDRRRRGRLDVGKSEEAAAAALTGKIREYREREKIIIAPMCVWRIDLQSRDLSISLLHGHVHRREPRVPLFYDIESP